MGTFYNYQLKINQRNRRSKTILRNHRPTKSRRNRS